jgi:hypothetical protein
VATDDRSGFDGVGPVWNGVHVLRDEMGPPAPGGRLWRDTDPTRKAASGDGVHAAPIVAVLEDLRDVRHITELRGKEAVS